MSKIISNDMITIETIEGKIKLFKNLIISTKKKIDKINGNIRPDQSYLNFLTYTYNYRKGILEDLYEEQVKALKN